MSRSSAPPSRTRLLVAAALAVILTAAGCSTKSDQTTQAAAGELATGPGVTDQVIKLGVLTDRTGPFAAAGKSAEQGRQLFWDTEERPGRRL